MPRTDRPFQINGVSIPTPDKYKFGVEDLSSQATGRTLDGTMHKDVVAVKDYYECTWSRLSWEDCATILNAIDGKSSVQFTHADPRVPGTWITGTYYVGQRGGNALDLSDLPRAWAEISFTFTKI